MMIIKRILAPALSFALLLCLAGCGAHVSDGGSGVNTKNTETVAAANTSADEKGTEAVSGESAPDDKNGENTEMKTKILVAYFSRTGENYGVGTITYGNTHIIADMIAENVGADMFEIARVTPYPDGYSDCTDEAKKEQNANARPALTATVDNFDDYDVIFLGYPNWWGDMPMPVYTFLESYNFSGKTVVPFCTHGGSGLSGTVKTLTNKLTGATVLEGLAVAGTTAQNDRDTAKSAVEAWLTKLNLGA